MARIPRLPSRPISDVRAIATPDGGMVHRLIRQRKPNALYTPRMVRSYTHTAPDGEATSVTTHMPGRLTPLGRKSAVTAGVASAAGGTYAYKRKKVKKSMGTSVWGVDHGDEVSKHYLGRHGEEHHHDRSMHRTLRHDKKKYKRYANSASSNAYHSGAKKAKDTGSDTWYDVGESVHGLLGGDAYKYRQSAGARPSEKAGYKSQTEWEQSKTGRSARRKQGRAKADWNPRWGERNGYKKKDVRKSYEEHEAIQKGFTPILSNAGKGASLSPATRALRVGQVGGQAQRAGARAQFGGKASSQFGAAAAKIGARRTQGASRFGGASSQQFGPVTQKIAGQRSAGAARFGQSQGGGAVPRGAGAAAHSAASGLRTPTPPKVPNALGPNRKKIAIGAGAVGAGGVGYGVSR